MGETKTIILNGTKVWFGVLFFIIVHGGAGVWWASAINTSVKHVQEEIVEVKEEIKDVKKDIYEIRNR